MNRYFPCTQIGTLRCSTRYFPVLSNGYFPVLRGENNELSIGTFAERLTHAPFGTVVFTVGLTVESLAAASLLGPWVQEQRIKRRHFPRTPFSPLAQLPELQQGWNGSIASNAPPSLVGSSSEVPERQRAVRAG